MQYYTCVMEEKHFIKLTIWLVAQATYAVRSFFFSFLGFNFKSWFSIATNNPIKCQPLNYNGKLLTRDKPKGVLQQVEYY